MSFFLSLRLMRRVFCLTIILTFLIPLSCTSGKGGVKQTDKERILTVLATVPSDALCIGYASDCRLSDMVMDSTSTFFSLGINRLRGCGMALSQCYAGKVVPILSIAPVPTQFSSDTSSTFNSVISAASRKGFKTLFLSDSPSLPDGMGVLLISPSDAQLKASERHIRAGRSILDMERLRQAVDSLPSSDQMVILRNSGAARLLDKSFLGGRFRTSEAGALMHRSAEWTFFSKDGDGDVRVNFSCPGGYLYMAGFLGSLPGSDSRIGRMLPATTSFALTLTVPGDVFRQGYEKYLDANVRMVKYQGRIRELARSTGKSPIKWEKELDVREIATVNFDSYRVVLLREGKKVAPAEPFVNPYQGFAGALYGTAFSLSDDSCAAVRDGWMAVGDEESVKAWYTSEFENNGFDKWPSKNIRFSLYYAGKSAVWDVKGMKIWNLDQ